MKRGKFLRSLLAMPAALVPAGEEPAIRRTESGALRIDGDLEVHGDFRAGFGRTIKGDELVTLVVYRPDVGIIDGGTG